MEHYNNELYHYGKLGMKWGVRRYQNKDGSLTNAGKKRYARNARNEGFTEYDDETSRYYKESKKNGRSDLEANPDKWVKEDLERTKGLTESTKRFAEDLGKVNEKAIKKAPRKEIDLSSMTDQDLRNHINRAILEKQYNDFYNPPQVSKGREHARDILDDVGNVLMVTGSALGIALSIQTLMKG